MNLGRYAKLVTALVAGAIGWATLVVNSPAAHISSSEWIVGASALAAAFGVFIVPNTPPAP